MTGDQDDGSAGDPPDGSRLRRALAVVRRRWRTIALVVVAVLALVLVGVVAYFGTPLPVDRAAADSVRENPEVTVERAHDGYVLRPSDPPDDGPTTALVFYPGGRVDPESYLYTLAPLVERAGIRVYVPGMPLNLAVLDGDAAAEVIDNDPDVDRWYVGGHSLGGSFACRYAAADPGRVDGVVLFASYCDRSLNDTGLSALVVVGDRDEVLSRDSFEENRENLPADARIVRIDGMNHSQFGAYSGQSGDVPGTIDRETARDRLASAVLSWHRNRTGRRVGPVRGRSPATEGGSRRANRRPTGPAPVGLLRGIVATGAPS